MTNTAAPCGDEKCIHEDTCELSGGDHCRWTTEDDMTTIPVKTYTERQVLDMLRILAWMIRCDNCLLNEKCEVEDICQCKKSLIDYAKNNPIKEVGEK